MSFPYGSFNISSPLRLRSALWLSSLLTNAAKAARVDDLVKELNLLKEELVKERRLKDGAISKVQ